jgi:hypothetical protein
MFVRLLLVASENESEEKLLMSIVQVKTIDRRLIIELNHSIEQFNIKLNLQGKLIAVDPKSVSFSLSLGGTLTRVVD